MIDIFSRQHSNNFELTACSASVKMYTTCLTSIKQKHTT